MATLVKDIMIADPSSPFNGLQGDLLIQRNKIEKFGKNIRVKAAKVIEGGGSYLSPGWVDVLADYREPGLEYKETIATGLKAARAGGFTEVIIVPNTNPPLTNASMLEFIQQRAMGQPVKLHAMGAISKNIEGRELSEMMDMYHSGAKAFSDGWKPLQDAMVMLKALEYVKAFDGLIVQIPIHASLSEGGLMNESETSVTLGMSSIPTMSEAMLIQRDLELLRYTQSRIHFSGITTKASVDLIKAAKKEGLKVSCSVTPYHLLFDDTNLSEYDSNYKVNPPLRTRKERNLLIDALANGVIDCIATHHRPQDVDAKNQEFAYAGWGMNCQETCWSMLLKAAPKIKAVQWAQLLSINPRKIFNLNRLSIDVGQPANLTIFNQNESWLFDSLGKQSKGINNPWLGNQITGKAYSL